MSRLKNNSNIDSKTSLCDEKEEKAEKTKK